MSVTVRVDHGLCLGARMCEIRAGHLFTVTPDGVAVPERQVLESAADIDAATEAIDGCPTAAISVTDEH